MQSVTLNETSLTLEYGETRTLTATVLPWNADNRYVYWSSSNPDVVWLTGDGIITASEYYEGTATITAQAGDKMATCTVTVKPPMVQNIMLDETEVWLAPGDRIILIATVTPNNAASPTWSSSNPEVAMVDDYGMITAVAEGTAIITAQVDGFKATCVVFVNKESHEQPGFPGAVESVTLNTYKLTIEPGGTRTLIATVYPYDADDKTVVWSAFNPLIATVDDDGKVTAISEGSTFITARVGDKTAECEVDVKTILVPVESVTLDCEMLTLTRGETRKLTATVLPSNAEDKSVAWSSSDTEVATVSHDGTVMAHSVGDVTIKAQAGYKVAECEVTVNPKPIDSIELDKTTLPLLALDMTIDLTATLTPRDAEDKTLIWTSSNETIATVSGLPFYDGKAKARVKTLKEGKATITATAKVGGKTATCEVIVHKCAYKDGKCTVCERNPKMKDGVIDENGVLTKYSGGGSVEIPYGVTGIGNMAFYNCGITSVTIPASVTSIGNSAFFYCRSLKSVEIPASVTSIGAGAFSYCESLKSVEIPASVTSIGNRTFCECDGLTSVTIPASVKSIGSEAFTGCTNLNTVKYDGSLADWCSITWADYSANPLHNENAILYIGSNAVMDAVIPNGVTEIKNYAFCWYNNLKSVEIPASVTSIGNSAFFYCNGLTSVVIPSGVTSIGDNAFYCCNGLTSVVIPSGVTSIGNEAFYGCRKLESVEIPVSVTSIGEYAFHSCNKDMYVKYDGAWSDWKGIKKDKYIFDDDVMITGKTGSTFNP